MTIRYLAPAIPVIIAIQWTQTNFQELVDFRNSAGVTAGMSNPVDNGDSTITIGSVTLSSGDWVYLYLVADDPIRSSWVVGTCTGASAQGQHLSAHSNPLASTEWEFPNFPPV